MRISERYNLNKGQAELDFIDIDIAQDIPLFLDPFFLSRRQDLWSAEATKNIENFFQRVIYLLRQGNINEAKLLFEHLNEPNSTCLGLSQGIPKGRGVGKGNTNDIFESLVNSRAVHSGLVQDLEDNILFVKGFGKDKLSDMTTNIIRKYLIEYTQSQCALHGIPMQHNVLSGFYWNRKTMLWEQSSTDMLVIEGKIILLVPKGVVSFCRTYTPERYYNHFVLNFMQNEHININSALVQKRKDGTPFVEKKILKVEYPFSKDFLIDFSIQHPEILENFKQNTLITPLTNDEISNSYIDIQALIIYLIQQLRSIPSGDADATHYHKLIIGVLELIFYPKLIYPALEQEIYNDQKSIDITFYNAASTGLFLRFSRGMDLPRQYIMIECKNYSLDSANPEIDRLIGRFSSNRGKVGFLLGRDIDNMELFINCCRDIYRNNRGLIVPLTDVDIIDILEHYASGDANYTNTLIAKRVKMIVTN